MKHVAFLIPMLMLNTVSCSAVITSTPAPGMSTVEKEQTLTAREYRLVESLRDAFLDDTGIVAESALTPQTLINLITAFKNASGAECEAAINAFTDQNSKYGTYWNGDGVAVFPHFDFGERFQERQMITNDEINGLKITLKVIANGSSKVRISEGGYTPHSFTVSLGSPEMKKKFTFCIGHSLSDAERLALKK